jgi:hypothetical protein
MRQSLVTDFTGASHSRAPTKRLVLPSRIEVHAAYDATPPAVTVVADPFADALDATQELVLFPTSISPSLATPRTPVSPSTPRSPRPQLRIDTAASPAPAPARRPHSVGPQETACTRVHSTEGDAASSRRQQKPLAAPVLLPPPVSRPRRKSWSEWAANLIPGCRPSRHGRHGVQEQEQARALGPERKPAPFLRTARNAFPPPPQEKPGRPLPVENGYTV